MRRQTPFSTSDESSALAVVFCTSAVMLMSKPSVPITNDRAAVMGSSGVRLTTARLAGSAKNSPT